jgi:6-phosphogluconolactonase
MGIALYASVGPELTHYDADVERAALVRRGSVSLPANVHYAWPHASRRFLYVASSDGGPGGTAAGSRHHVSAFTINPASGELASYGDRVVLPARPIHMTTDIPSENILVAFSNPSGLRVYRIHPDGSPGDEVAQPQPIDPGIYAHQVRVALDNSRTVLVTRGNDAAGGKPEDPGALKLFDYRAGLLSRERSIAPGGGWGFGPRHLDFHPARPWVYVSLERQNRLDVFDMTGGSLSAAPIFCKTTLSGPVPAAVRQVAGTVHVHPSGRFVYVANRASSTVEIDGRAVFAGGENTLAGYRIDDRTGEPRLIQHADTHGIHCRTFHIDPSGRLLIAAHIMGLPVRDGGQFRMVPANLSLFRIAADGKLDFVRSYEVETGGRSLFWMGMVAL